MNDARRITRLKLLAINDFHGNLAPPALAGDRPAGGAAVLAAYLEDAEREAPGRSLIVHAGDQVGAAPPATRLLASEPGIEFLNLMAGDGCPTGRATHFYAARYRREDPDRCNVIGTLGNHEFDLGVDEIRRLLEGGQAKDGPYLETPWRGSRVPYVCANVRERRSGKLLLPPYAVVVLDGVPIGIVGAVLRDTPSIVPAWAARDVEFLDEASSINRAVRELERQGVHAIIVTIHQGFTPVRRDGVLEYLGPLRNIVARLDAGVGVVISGHTHQFTNVLLPNRARRPVLVTQAYAFGVAYADIELDVDRDRDEIVYKSARIVPTWRDAGPGLHPDEAVDRLVSEADAFVAPRVGRVIATLPRPLTRAVTAAGESVLGDLVADAQRSVTQADIAMMNPGGLRSDLRSGPLTWGDILTLHPFGNRLMTLELTGRQIADVLEQQWPRRRDALPRVLEVSGIRYVWDPARSPGHRIVELCDDGGRPLDRDRAYRVTVNDFLAGGGDGFTRLARRSAPAPGPLDAEALDTYLTHHREAVNTRIDGRIGIIVDGSTTRCRD